VSLCPQKFPNKEELLRNMMGLLGNVAEVRELRHFLVTSKYLTVFSDLLDSRSDGIEVSYNAAGVISHIASDGPDVWMVFQPTRSDVLNKMVCAIDRWDLNSQRNINYRSFEPILYLVKVYHTPECQKWAVWALANLTKVYPEKYCSLIEKEGGLVLLQELIEHPLPPLPVKNLAAMVIDNCKRYKEQEWTNVEAQLDG
jgi:Zyg-11 family protein